MLTKILHGRLNCICQHKQMILSLKYVYLCQIWINLPCPNNDGVVGVSWENFDLN